MKRPLWEQLDNIARNLTPFGLTVVMVLINVVPIRFADLAQVAPVLPLMAVFHWAIYRPELLPGYAVFLIGILQDILTGAPIGLNAAVFTAVYWGVLSQRRFLFGKSFLIVWWGFALVLFLALLATWMLMSIYHLTPVISEALAFQYLMTLGGFPILAWFFLRWQKSILRLED